MRYASIREMDISNGEGIGVSLFVQGCNRRCKNCFNPETWNFNGGYLFDDGKMQRLIELISKPYIKRFSLLGGEPLHPKNLYDVANIITTIKHNRPDIKIWIHTGYRWEEIIGYIKGKEYENFIQDIDIIVDGEYIDNKRDITIKYRGSSNQRIIDVQESLKLTNGITNPILYLN